MFSKLNQRNFTLFLYLSSLMSLLILTVSLTHVICEALTIFHVKNFAFIFPFKILSLLACLFYSHYYSDKSFYPRLLFYFSVYHVIFALGILFSYFLPLDFIEHFKTLLLIFANLVGDVYCTLSMLYFWQVANAKFSFTESKYYYPAINIVGTFTLAIGHLIYKNLSYCSIELLLSILAFIISILAVFKYRLFMYSNSFESDSFNSQEEVNEGEENISTHVPYYYGWWIIIIACMNILTQHMFEYLFKGSIYHSVKDIHEYLYDHGDRHFYITIKNLFISIIINTFAGHFRWFTRAVIGPIINIIVSILLIAITRESFYFMFVLSNYNSTIRAIRSTLIDPTRNSALLCFAEKDKIFWKSREVFCERLIKMLSFCILFLLIESKYTLFIMNISFCIIWFYLIRKISYYILLRKKDGEELVDSS